MVTMQVDGLRYRGGIRSLRNCLKSIPLLYWAVGWVRYLQFRQALKRYQFEYDAQPAQVQPPPMLRYRVHGVLDESSYVEAGRNIALAMVEILRDAGVPLAGRDVLDFACGPGRVISYFHKLVPDARLAGSDLDREAIDWARANLGKVASFHCNDADPPTAFDDGSFDVIYSISLFTHLNAAAQDFWLQEFARLLRPGGVLLATIHGRLAMASCTHAERTVLDREGIAFRVDRKGRFKLDGLPDFYQTTFHTRDYVERHWAQFLNLQTYREGGIGNHQDVVLLAKPAN